MIPGVSHLNGLIDWFGALDTHRIEVAAGPIRFDLINTMTTLGIGALQAVVIISIIQLIFAPVRGFAAWRRDTPTYLAAFVLEVVLGAFLFFAARPSY